MYDLDVANRNAGRLRQSIGSNHKAMCETGMGGAVARQSPGLSLRPASRLSRGFNFPLASNDNSLVETIHLKAPGMHDARC